MTFSKQRKPTEAETEILKILWEKQKASVREVHESLCDHKESGYTTTLKLMQIMLDKKLVSRDDTHKIHIYSPLVSQETIRKNSISSLVHHLFSGSSTNLVMHALGNHQLTKAELQEIEDYIATLKNK